jgi:flagellar FliL protein
MSAAAQAVADGAPPKKGKKKLIIIIAASVLLLAGVGGGGAWFMMKQKAAAAAEADGEEEAAPVHKAHSEVPLYVPLDPFVVNLADRDADRYAQIGVTLQIDDAKFADQIKVFMPAIRNGILMTLAHKTSEELLQRSGKEELAAEIMREAVRPMGIEIDHQDDPDADEDEESKPGKKKKKKKKKRVVHNPVTNVHFSNFIIQ